MQQGFGFFTWFAFFLGKLYLAQHTSLKWKLKHITKSSSTENKFSNSDRKFLFEKVGSNNSITKLLIPS